MLNSIDKSKKNYKNKSKKPKTCEFSTDSSFGELISETEYWEIFLAPSQRYLGTCVISLKRGEIWDLKDLKTEEWIDFGNLVEAMEIANRKIFNADLFNWSCLKNSVFRKNNPKPHIHWHFIPRYENPIVFEGLEFDDPDFGYFARAIHKKIPNNLRDKLLKLMKDNLIL
jgi:diadenosine tetraphosphate (Ap4A) HIT family hydrolase